MKVDTFWFFSEEPCSIQRPALENGYEDRSQKPCQDEKTDNVDGLHKHPRCFEHASVQQEQRDLDRKHRDSVLYYYCEGELFTLQILVERLYTELYRQAGDYENTNLKPSL